MKKLSRLALFTAACAAIAAPVLAADVPDGAALPEDGVYTEEVLIEDDDLFADEITIEEEEVPLAAMPLGMVEANGALSARAITTMGMLMMGLSAVGLVFTRAREARN